MAKVRHDEIIPECNIDTNLVETLLKMINLERFLFAEKRHNPCRYRIKCLILQPISPNMRINCDNNYV